MTEPILPIVAMGAAEYMNGADEGAAAGTIARDAFSSGRFADIARGKTVLALGPGLGTIAMEESIREPTVSTVELPIVLDAERTRCLRWPRGGIVQSKDGASGSHATSGRDGALVGSFGGRGGARSREDGQRRGASLESCVLLKGFQTASAGPDGRVFVNTTGTPALAKGGSGDVLTGLLAALIAQFGTDDLLRIVALGAYLHGAAAELLTQQSDNSGIIAAELAHAIP